jgi:hypothetical protein
MEFPFRREARRPKGAGSKLASGASTANDATMRAVDDPYRVLGLPQGASSEDLRRARRRLAKELHPDAAGRGHEAMAAVNRAYDEATAVSVHPAEAVVSVDGLPVEAFEVVRLAVDDLGEVVTADEPYLLEGYLAEPRACFVRVELVPEAGGSQVTVTVAPAEGVSPPSAGDVAALLTRPR